MRPNELAVSWEIAMMRIDLIRVQALRTNDPVRLEALSGEAEAIFRGQVELREEYLVAEMNRQPRTWRDRLLGRRRTEDDGTGA